MANTTTQSSVLSVDRVRQLNDAVKPLMVVFENFGNSYYKAGNDPIMGTEIYILPVDEDTLKACRADKKAYRLQPVGKGVGNSISQFARDACRNQPTVDVNGVKVLQMSLLDVLTNIALDWGLLEWYTYPSRPGMRFICSRHDGGKLIIDYRPQKVRNAGIVVSGRL